MMTIKEFWEHVDSIDIESREDGRFTEDEMFEIGVMFKTQLDNGQKREIGGWDYLTSVLKPLDKDGNVMTKGDTFRQWIKDRCYRTGTMEPNVHLLSGKTIETISFGDFTEKTEEIKKDLYKQQVKTRDHINAYRALLRDDARMELMRDLIKECVTAKNEFEPLDCSKVADYEADEDAEGVLLFSDWHLGMQIDNFYNHYNVEIARNRVQRVLEITLLEAEKNHIHTLHVLNLGDLIVNTLHTVPRILQEIDAVQQTMVAAEILSQFLVELAKVIPEVTYRSCLDNHSRLTPDLKQSLDSESLAYIIDWYIADRIKDSGVQMMNDNLDPNIGMFTLKNGDNFVFAHGHKIDANQSIQRFTAATRKYIKYVAIGHLHETKMKTFMNSKVFVNGSGCGLDSYALGKCLFGTAEQTLLIFTGHSLNNVTIELDDVK